MNLDPAARRLRLDPRDPVFFQDPYPAYRVMREAGPLVFWEDYGFWCAAGFDAVNALLRDRRFGREVLHVTTREALGRPERPAHTAPFYAVDDHSMLEREPPVHTRLRTLVNRAFVSRRIERLRPRVAALANGLIDGFAEAGEVDLIPAFATPIPVIVIAELLGVPADMAPALVAWSRRMVGMYEFGRTYDAEVAAAEAAGEFSAYLRDLAEERRRAPRDDLVSHLLAAEAVGDRLSEPELVATCILLLNAGHEATVHAIGNAVKALLETGAAPASAFADEGATERTVEEALRFDPPLHLFTRYALEPLSFGGVDFAVGDKVALLLAAANRDPARWEEPDRFRADRPMLPHLSFGAGIHFCLGAPLARLELQVALPILFRRLPGLALAEAPRYRDAFHFHGLKRLALSWQLGTRSGLVAEAPGVQRTVGSIRGPDQGRHGRRRTGARAPGTRSRNASR